MINYDKRDLLKILEGNREGKLFLSNNLYFEFKKMEGTVQTKFILFYKGNKIGHDFFFTETKDIGSLANNINKKINFLFNKFVMKFEEFHSDKEYLFLEEVIRFIIRKKVLDSWNNFLIKSFNEIVIISVEYSNNNREIFLLSNNSNKITYRSVKIKNEFVNEYSVYNPYEFILKYNLFQDSTFYNKLVAELSYKLSI